MKRPLKHDLVQAEINVMPLIDVCLVLMIILLVVFPMVKVTASPAVKTRAKPIPGVLALEEPQLAVAILADGSLTVDGEPVALADFQKKLGEIWTLTPNRPVVVKGNRHVRYAQVRWVLQSVNAAGFRRASLTR